MEDLKHAKSKTGESIGETWGIYDGLIACSLEVLGNCGVPGDQLKRFRVLETDLLAKKKVFDIGQILKWVAQF